MISVVHDDYVFSFGVCCRTETRPKKPDQKNVAREANPHMPNDHFVTPRPTRDRRNIRAPSDRQNAYPAKLDTGNASGSAPPTPGSRRILEELDLAATVPAFGNLEDQQLIIIDRRC